jgi:hypothetical protein
MGYRRFCCKSDTELQHAYGLIKKDYENCTIEQVLNMCVELHRRGQFNQLGGFLNWLGTLNSIPVGSQEEYRIVPG